jgi:hypothetical protein
MLDWHYIDTVVTSGLAAAAHKGPVQHIAAALTEDDVALQLANSGCKAYCQL